MKPIFGSSLTGDIKSSFVVFLVALPLCLGIAMASGAPPISGLIAGVIGGIVIGILSNSQVSVSGPAAGLTVIVLDSISTLGSFEIFLAALVVAGLIQLFMGVIKAGIIGDYIPHAVIKGMLTAIGLILILKQIPHALGYDKDYMGDLSFQQLDQHTSFSEIYYALLSFNPGALLATLISLLFLLIFEHPIIKANPLFRMIPGALLAVVSGVGINVLYFHFIPEWYLSGENLVSIPILNTIGDFSGFLSFPDFWGVWNSNFWLVAFSLALIGSIETLLSIEAGDKMDPSNRITSPNRELVAQGIGNTVSGLVGGLPITAVIVRTSANINSGAQTKASTILHGLLLVVFTLTIPDLLNKIPLSSLAAILLSVGYKLAKPAMFNEEFQKGIPQFLPFLITVIVVVLTDLLIGIGIGTTVGLILAYRPHYKKAINFSKKDETYQFIFENKTTFLNKAFLRKKLEKIPAGSQVLLKVKDGVSIDFDIYETINGFIQSSNARNLKVKTEGLKI